METTLIILIAIAFVGVLIINLFFRARVLKAYKQLVRARIDFDGKDVLQQERIEQLVSKYPAQEQAIRQFTGGIRNSVSMMMGLIVLITLLGAVLMWYR